jgi:hypothetical protein
VFDLGHPTAEAVSLLLVLCRGQDGTNDVMVYFLCFCLPSLDIP